MDSYWMFINFTVDLCHIIDKNTFIQDVHEKRGRAGEHNRFLLHGWYEASFDNIFK